MKHKIASIMIFLSTLIVSQLFAAASPKKKAELQARSLEKLEIEITEVKKETKSGFAFLEVTAKVIKVTASKTKLKEGDEIKIIYETPTKKGRNTGKVPPGDWASEIVKDGKYYAYLGKVHAANWNQEAENEEWVKINRDKIRATKGTVYEPTAVSASFESLKKEK